MRALGSAAAVCLAALGAPAPAAADLIDVFGAWSAFSTKEGKKTVCFMGSAPKKEEGKYKRRGKTLIVVTHRPADKAFNEINLRAGYTYKPNSKVQLVIDGVTFELFTQGSDAWADTAVADSALMTAMKAGQRMVARGTSARGTETTDTYSLTGFTAAYKAIGRACGVK